MHFRDLSMKKLIDFTKKPKTARRGWFVFCLVDLSMMRPDWIKHHSIAWQWALLFVSHALFFCMAQRAYERGERRNDEDDFLV
jgi:hypothetical protein